MAINIRPVSVLSNKSNFKGNVLNDISQHQTQPQATKLTPKQKVDEFVSTHKKEIKIGAAIAAATAVTAGAIVLISKGKRPKAEEISKTANEIGSKITEAIDPEALSKECTENSRNLQQEAQNVINMFAGDTGIYNRIWYIYDEALVNTNKQGTFSLQAGVGIIQNQTRSVKECFKNIDTTSANLKTGIEQLEKIKPEKAETYSQKLASDLDIANYYRPLLPIMEKINSFRQKAPDGSSFYDFEGLKKYFMQFENFGDIAKLLK